MQVDFTEDELKVILHDIIMMSDDKNHTQPELDNQVQAIVKINEALAKLEAEKTYPVQAIFDDFKDKKYKWRTCKCNWFYWGDGGVLIHDGVDIDVRIFGNFLTEKYYRRERKDNE